MKNNQLTPGDEPATCDYSFGIEQEQTEITKKCNGVVAAGASSRLASFKLTGKYYCRDQTDL